MADINNAEELSESFKINPNSFFMGCFIGKRIAGMRKKLQHRSPVAYLYNGNRLPDIYSVYTPELQKTHPYAFILGLPSIGVMWLYVTSNVEVNVSSNSDCIRFYKDTALMSVIQTDGNGDYPAEWPELGAIEDETYNAFLSAVKWTNCDIHKLDGTLYLAASDPVPVYE